MTPAVPSMTSKQEQGVRSREEILDAAERLMGSRGYAATSISTLSKESGLPASSIYWHFGSKSGVLGAVLERGSRRLFGAAEADGVEEADDVPVPAEPRDRLAAFLRIATATVRERPQFLRLFFMLLLGGEGDHDQNEVVAQVRTEGMRLLCLQVRHAYAPWGDAVAERVGRELCDVATALFDGIFIAGQTAQASDPELVDRAVAALHGLAEEIRAGTT